jgi:anti-anti-sigma regulatory factor
MYQNFSFHKESIGNIRLIRLKGYLEDTGSVSLKAYIQECLDANISLFAFDFSEIDLISSPGVAALLDIGGIVVDDFAGNIAAWGIDKHHSAILEMSGLFFLLNLVSNEEEAITWLKAEV